jgi:hypothetical protein
MANVLLREKKLLSKTIKNKENSYNIDSKALCLLHSVKNFFFFVSQWWLEGIVWKPLTIFLICSICIGSVAELYAQNVFYKSYTQFLKLITKKSIFESPFLYLSKNISAQSESTDIDLHSFMDIKNPFNFDRDLVQIS